METDEKPGALNEVPGLWDLERRSWAQPSSKPGAIVVTGMFGGKRNLYVNALLAVRTNALHPGLKHFQAYGGCLAFTTSLDLEGNSLAFLEGAYPGSFNGADLHEHVTAAAIWMDEAITLLRVEPSWVSLSKFCRLVPRP